jgi:hypothetical protein
MPPTLPIANGSGSNGDPGGGKSRSNTIAGGCRDRKGVVCYRFFLITKSSEEPKLIVTKVLEDLAGEE